MRTYTRIAVMLTAAVSLFSSAAFADTLTLSGSQAFSDGSYNFTLSASARFDLVGSNLSVTLTNTSAADAMIPSEILTAVFFNLPSNVTLDPVRALLNTGSTVWNGPINGGNLGSEWAYNDTMTNPGNAVFASLGSGIEGISSSGLGLFGPGDRFDTSTNLQGPTSPAGLQYGITSAGDNQNTGNAALFSNALIMNSMVFSFNVDGALDINSIRDVVFQYGTATSEPSFHNFRSRPRPPVPEPSTMLLLAGGLALAGLKKRFS